MCLLRWVQKLLRLDVYLLIMYYILKKASRRTSSRVKVNYNNKRVAAMDAGKAAGEAPKTTTLVSPSVSERWSEESSSESPVRPKTPPKTSAPKPAPAEDQQVLWCPSTCAANTTWAGRLPRTSRRSGLLRLPTRRPRLKLQKQLSDIKANATKLVLKTPVPH